MQSALNVDKNVKFHSSLTQTDLYTAENVTLNEDPREEIDTKPASQNLFLIFNLFYIIFLSQSRMWNVKSNYNSCMIWNTDWRFHLEVCCG